MNTSPSNLLQRLLRSQARGVASANLIVRRAGRMAPTAAIRVSASMLALFALFGFNPQTLAATVTKSATTGDLSLAASWVGSALPGTGDIALFNNTITAAQTDTITSANLSIGEIQIANPGGAITISGPDTLTLNAVNGVGIDDYTSATKGLTLNAAVVLGANQLWEVGSSGSLTVTDGISGTSLGFTKTGPGTLTINTTASTFTGTMTLDGGLTQLTNPSAATNFISSSASLAINGGLLDEAQTGTASTNTQTYAGTSIGQGEGQIEFGRVSGGTVIVMVGTVTRAAGGTVEFNGPISKNTNQYIETSNATGFIGGWAYTDSLDYASSNGASANITNVGNTANTWATGDNTSVTGNFTAASAATTQSLWFGTAGAYTVTLAGAEVISSGGILMNTTPVGNAETITGGTSLTSGNGTDLIVGQFDTTAGGSLSINSPIINNGATSIGLTKVGGGLLILGGANTFSGPVYLNDGEIELNSSGALGSGANAIDFGNSYNSSGTLALNGFSATVAGLSTANVSDGIPIVEDNASGSSVLTINNTGSAQVFNGTVQNGSTGKLGVILSGGTQTLAGSNTYTGNTTVSAGTLIFTSSIPSSPTYSIAGGSTLNTSAAGTLTLGANVTLSTGAAASTTATETGAVALSGGSIITGAAGSTLQITSLNVANGSLTFSITDPSTTTGISGLINVTSSNGLTLSGGSVTLSGGTFTHGNTYNVIYNLFQYTGTLGGATTNLSVAAPSQVNGLTYTFGTSGGYVTLTIAGSPLFTANWITDGSSSWSNSANWDAGIPNGQYDTANFGGAASTHATLARSVTLDGAETVGVLSFASPNGESYTISQGSAGNLTLDNGVNSANIAVGGIHTIDSTVAIAANSNVTVGTTLSTDKLTIGGVISNGSGLAANSLTYATLTKSGPGTLVLANANTYGPSAGTVGTTLTGGTVQFQNSSSFGNGNISLSSNATLQAGAAGLTLANAIAIGSGVTGIIDTAGNTVGVSGVISGATGALTVASSTSGGTLDITNSDTYGGGTIINSGATLNIGNGTTAGSVTGAITDNGTLTFNRCDAGTVSLVNVISGSGSVIENDPTSGGILKLTVANSYTGGTTITAGEIQIGNAGALGTGDVNTNANAIDLDGLSLTIGALNGSGTVDSSATGTMVLGLGGNNDSGTFTGAIKNTNGTVAVSKYGSGTQSLTGANTYVGATEVFQGGLTIGGTSDLVGTGNVDLIDANGTTSTLAGSLTVQDNAIISTTGYLRLASNDGQNTNNYAGPGTVLLKNNAQVTVASVAFGSGSRVPTGNSITIQDSAILTVNGALDLLHTEGSTLGGTALNLNGGTLALQNFIASGGGTAASTATISFNGGVVEALANDPTSSTFLPALAPAGLTVTDSVAANGAIFNTNGFSDTIAAALVHGSGSPDGGLTKNGAGTLILTGANTYNGVTNINAGTLQVGNGGTTGTLGTSAGVVTNSSSLVFDRSDTAYTVGNALEGAGTFEIMGGGTITFTGANGYSGVTTVTGASTLNINSVYALGGGNYGGLTLNNGTLQYASTLANGVTDLTLFSKAVTLTGADKIDTNGNKVSFANDLGAAGSGSLTVADTAGGGSLTLAGGADYSGATTVNSSAKLIVSGGLSATSGVTASGYFEADSTINNSATVNVTGGTLAGTGNVGVVATTGGTLAPGNTIGSAAAGNLTANGNVTLDSTATFSIRIGVVSETDNDSLTIGSGVVALNDASLAVNVGASANDSSLADVGDLYTIINGGASGTGTGTDVFGNVNTSGAVPTFTTSGGFTFDVLYGVTPTSETTYTTGGNDVVLQLASVPEPGTWASLLGGLGMLLVWQKNRRRRSSV